MWELFRLTELLYELNITCILYILHFLECAWHIVNVIPVFAAIIVVFVTIIIIDIEESDKWKRKTKCRTMYHMPLFV